MGGTKNTEKRRQEMSQIYLSPKNEFVFSDKGGKGKHLSSFLRNLSLTSSGQSDSYKDVNRNIYGNMGVDYKDIDNRPSYQRSHSVGASFSHLSSTPSNRQEPKDLSKVLGLQPNLSKSVLSLKRASGVNKYTDSDDDWDAALEGDFGKKSAESFGGVIPDPLYPDLTVVNPSVKNEPDQVDVELKSEVIKLNQLNSKYAKFRKLLTQNSIIPMNDLRSLAWNGIPSELRALSWQLLLGYLPANKARQMSTLKRKRQEYLEGLNMMTVDINDEKPLLTPVNSNVAREKQLAHQIFIDVKRTNPTVKLYGDKNVQQSLRRVLFLWAIRHPASGYVQGINDLATPFFQLFLMNYLWQLQQKDENDLYIPGLLDPNDEIENKLISDAKLGQYDVETLDVSLISPRALSIIEADTYWCVSKLLETITDSYIHEQPGIIRQVNELRNLTSKIDLELLTHLEAEGVEFIQFAFRWMNCLLMREVSMNLTIRMWDTYLSETPLGFNNFHVYVCAAFLIRFSGDLKQKDFQGILLFLQTPPTSHWTEKDIELILSEAFIWQSLYKHAGAHLRA